MKICRAVNTAALLLAFFFNQQSKGQDKPTRIVNSLNDIIIPIQTIKPDSNFDDLGFLKQTLENRDIVSLGEATHGTKEFFLYKVRLTEFLVSSLGFKAIAFESDFSSVQKLDDFINNKVKNLDGGYNGFPLTQQTREMLHWLQNYNATQEIPDRVHLYGLEARGFNTICAAILNSFSNLSAQNKALFLKIQDVKYNAIDKNDIQAVKSIIPQLYQSDQNKNSLNRHYITLLEQTVDQYLDGKFGHRDKFMADNVAWMHENTNTEKVIIWAHNGHLSKSPLYGVPSLGTYLYQKYNSKYFAIATDFNVGSVLVSVLKNDKVDWINKFFPAVTSKNNYEYYFHQCKYPNFMINVSSLKDHLVLTPFFSESMFMRSVDATGELSKTKLSILENFDLVAFFNSTNPG
jgi:erythromycin esterase